MLLTLRALNRVGRISHVVSTGAGFKACEADVPLDTGLIVEVLVDRCTGIPGVDSETEDDCNSGVEDCGSCFDCCGANACVD